MLFLLAQAAAPAITEVEAAKGWLQIITQGGALGVLLLLIWKAPVWIQMLKDGRVELAKILSENHKEARTEFLTALEKNENRCLDQHKQTGLIVSSLADNIKENTTVTRTLVDRLNK